MTAGPKLHTYAENQAIIATALPADWLLTVLSVYFHDLGLLVTPQEFANRDKSGFRRFCDEQLFSGQHGKDYRARIAGLPPDDAERFLYQEFVRHNHASRIKAWIAGTPSEHLGVSNAVIEEVSKLLDPLKLPFRKDLGLVCESHHSNDLGDIKKYRVVQPYGNSPQETANLQYCAILLRTADLLHVTSDRTPSIEYRLLSPTDPVSQQEWAKQMAVTRVMAKTAVNEEGVSDPKLQSDTVEVHAYFTKEIGFFGLTTYLAYAGDQLKKSHEWISATAKAKKAPHLFPWRKIDDSNINTDGFLREAFQFTIDQAKILDLLTGHTLYNDTKVVLRELVQNAVDAIRVKNFEDPSSPVGSVKIHWNSDDRILSVEDTGVGMSQPVISNFLLRAGSSRYQDPEFKKSHPGFSSISRFGIGVLSTFMIADSVEIVTVCEEEEQARHLSLRSVHGKYLIRLLDKSDPIVRAIGAHGTRFLLRLRPSIEIASILETAKLWVVVPNCQVSCQINDGKPVPVGYANAAEALQEILKERAIDAEIIDDTTPPKSGQSKVRIFYREVDGLQLAYAVIWADYFTEWTFLSAETLGPREDRPLILGTSIEGIRVEMATPGFDGLSVVAFANVTGENAPKTNVARSGLENTPERDNLLKKIYGVYMGHIKSEIQELYTKRGFSLTWALKEARYLLQEFAPRSAFIQENTPQPLSKSSLDRALAELPILSLESDGVRKAVSVLDLKMLPAFWTVDCSLLHSVEPLITETRTSISASAVVESLKLNEFKMPDGPLLCGKGPDQKFESWVFSDREVSKMVIDITHRRIDLCWQKEGAPSLWVKSPLKTRHLFNHSPSVRSVRTDIRIARDGVVVTCNGPQPLAVRSDGSIYLLPGTPLSLYTAKIFEAPSGSYSELFSAGFVCVVLDHYINYNGKTSNSKDTLMKLARGFERDVEPPQYGLGDIEDWFDILAFAAVIDSTEWSLFDPARWLRTSSNNEVPF